MKSKQKYKNIKCRVLHTPGHGLGGARRYTRPVCTAIKLESSQAVLHACVVNGAYFIRLMNDTCMLRAAVTKPLCPRAVRGRSDHGNSIGGTIGSARS